MSRVQKVVDRLLIILVPMVGLGYIYSVPNGNDFFPIYLGAQWLMEGRSPYGVVATNLLISKWYTACALAGIAYPLPLLLLAVPLSLLAFPLAALLWTAGGFLLSYSFVLLGRAQSALHNHPAWFRTLTLILPLTFWPLHEAVNMSQATLIWFGLASVMVLTIERNKPWIVAMCVVLLVLKPQNGIIFALYGLYWLHRNHRQALLFAMLLGSTLLGASLILQPGWIPAWIQQMAVYKAEIKPNSLLPQGFIFLIVVWRLHMPWWAKVAIFQVILFPFSGIYSFLPLLIAWCAFSPLLAVVGTSLPWAWLLLPIDPDIRTTWLLLVLPLILVAAWETRPQKQRSAPLSPMSVAR